MSKPIKKVSVYASLIEAIFTRHYRDGLKEVLFHRDDIVEAASKLHLKPPKNLGDVIYSVRYRNSLPAAITRTQPKGFTWIIEGCGRSKYAFRLVADAPIAPNPALAVVKIPDSTPEIVSKYSLSDEQALLSKVRYNRLLDIFLGVTTFSLQNHLRTTVPDVGQIEIDEVYVGIDTRGRQFVLPVQAKGGSDRLSSVQTIQDIAWCAHKFPELRCRAISVQFVAEDLIALFELSRSEEIVRIVEERHYQLVPADNITREDLLRYDR